MARWLLTSITNGWLLVVPRKLEASAALPVVFHAASSVRSPPVTHPEQESCLPGATPRSPSENTPNPEVLLPYTPVPEVPLVPLTPNEDASLVLPLTPSFWPPW